MIVSVLTYHAPTEQHTDLSSFSSSQFKCPRKYGQVYHKNTFYNTLQPGISFYPSLSSIVMIKPPDTKRLVDERVYFNLLSRKQAVSEGSQGGTLSRAGTWRQDLKQKPRRNITYWLVPMTRSAFLVYPRTSSQVSCCWSLLGSPSASVGKIMPYRIASGYQKEAFG